jgi:hypothetical protein
MFYCKVYLAKYLCEKLLKFNVIVFYFNRSCRNTKKKYNIFLCINMLSQISQISQI